MEFQKVTKSAYLDNIMNFEQRETQDFRKAGMMNEFLKPQNTIVYLLIINIVGFLIMGIDKRKAKMMKWRIPEKTFFLVTLFGGGIGTIAGMYTFRHKTRKKYFTIGLPAMVIIEIVCVIYFIMG